MSTFLDTPKAARHAEGFIEIEMTGGQILRFPVADNRRLRNGTPEQLSDMEPSPFGLHWPQLDEDLSIRGILAGDHGN